MTTAHTFHRILLDLDVAGNPVGLSVEVHQDDRRTELVVLARPEPFEAVVECVIRARQFIRRRYGEHHVML